jgi:hypothetical protein
MVQTASCILGLSLQVPTRGSTALTLIGSRCAEAQGSRLLQRTLLGEVSRLTTCVASTALTAVGGVEGVVVVSGEVSS